MLRGPPDLISASDSLTDNVMMGFKDRGRFSDRPSNRCRLPQVITAIAQPLNFVSSHELHDCLMDYEIYAEVLTDKTVWNDYK